MSDATAPIELAPKRWSRASRALHGVRVGARWVHLGLTLAVVVGVFVQVYLIGAYIFGAGQGSLDAHKTAGWTVHGFEMLMFVTALVNRGVERPAPLELELPTNALFETVSVPPSLRMPPPPSASLVLPLAIVRLVMVDVTPL